MLWSVLENTDGPVWSVERVLGQLLAAQSILLIMPGVRRPFEFGAQVLASLPGVKACRFCLNEDLDRAKDPGFESCQRHPDDSTVRTENSELTSDADGALQKEKEPEILPVGAPGRCHGSLILEVDRSSEHYHKIKPFLLDFVCIMSLVIEANQQKAELHQKVERSEERYRRLVEGTSDLITIVDPAGRFSYVNPVGERVLGVSGKEAVGLSVYDFIHPEDRERTRQWLQSCMDARARQAQIENRQVNCKTGEFSVVMWTTTLDYDSDSETPVIYGIARDITEIRLAEEALKENRDRLDSIIKGANLGTWEWNVQTGELIVNQCWAEMIGYSLEELAPLTIDTCARFLHPEYLNTARHLLDACLENKSMYYECELWMRHKNGHWVWALDRGRVLDWTSDDKPIWMFGTRADITAHKLAEEKRQLLEGKMRHTQKLESLGVMAGGIAHDFNNLLMTILGNADLALQDLPPLSPVRSSLEEIEKTAQRGADLTKQMLAYSGRGAFEVQPLDLSKLVDEMSHLLKSCLSKKAQLTKQMDPELPWIQADAAQMQQVIMNLLTNASDAIGEDKPGIITVSTGALECSEAYLAQSYLPEKPKVGRYVFLEVSDTGCGMDERTKAALFDPFFSTKFIGRGLGLAAVLGIVKGHNGAILFRSEPGEGTTFRVLFPALAGSANGRNKEAESLQREEIWQGSGTILVVDDDPSVRRLAVRMLEQIGFQTLQAGDGREGVEQFKSNVQSITGVILDLTMPHMSGVEASLDIQQICSTTPIILSSGYDESEISERYNGYGIAGFLQKPYKMAKLRAVMKNILGTS